MAKTIRAVDLFCGAGGSSTGLREAVEAAGMKLDLLAVNHWDVAIATHEKNHPGAEHLCASISALDPKKVAKGKIDLLWASPECTHHSVARGGKPINDQSRMSAWEVVRWAADLLPAVILVENVKEFQTWGPIGTNGRPLKRRRGETFQAWLQAIRSLGYTVDYRVLNSADFGGVTTRQRLFVQARRGRSPICWPEATHSRTGGMNLFGGTERWRPAREIIDWTLEGQSIFTRKKPLAKATLERIAAGLRRFGGAKAEPFLLLLNRYKDRAYGVSEPMPTVTATSSDFALVEPFLLGQQSGGAPRSTGEPVPTIATSGAIALVEPFLLGAGGTSGQQKPQSLDAPLGTVLTEDRRALIEPFIVPFFGERPGQAPRTHGLDAPLPTVTGHGAGALIEPFAVVLRNNQGARSLESPLPTLTCSGANVGICEPFIVTASHGDSGGTRTRSVDEPLPTVTGSNDHAVVEPYIIPLNHGGRDFRSHSMDAPMPTITTVDAWGMVEPMLVEYNGTGDAHPVSQPVPTVTTRDRFGLLECDGYVLDIRFRMLQPHELAAAMGFPAGYEFAGNREQKVKQIGNAVEKHVARSLGAAALGLEAGAEVAA